MCLLSKRDVILNQKSKDTGFIRTYVCSTSRPIGRRLQIFTPRCPPRPRERCHEQLHHMCVHGRAAVAIYSRKSRSGDARLEVHSALLHPSGANNCAAGGTGPVRTQGNSWAPTVGVVRAHWWSRKVRRGSPEPKIVDFAPLDDGTCAPHHALSVGTYKYLHLAVLLGPGNDATSSCITCVSMGVLPWQYSDGTTGPVTQDWRCIQPSRCCSFTPMVPTTTLQVALVLSGPRATAGHRQSELFVFIGGVGRSGEGRQNRK